MNMMATVASRPGSQTSSRPILALQNVRRRFGETVALDDCSFDIAPGEIHGLVGENGSGKSTLIKILSGVLPPNEGAILWEGAPIKLDSPWQAQRLGVGTVFQETLVLDALSIRDNVMLGVDQRIMRKRTISEETAKVREVLGMLGLTRLNVETSVAALTLAQRQMIGIARSLVRPWRLLILDESTSALDVDDRDRLFEVLRAFRGRGHSILFVSHRMEEIANLVDRSTVLRSGKSIATLPTAEVSTERLLELMSSRQAASAANAHAAARPLHKRDNPVVSIRDLVLKPNKKPCHLDIYPGEILGVAGLEGHGQAAVLECVAGLRRPVAGVIRSGSHTVASASEARSRRFAFLPRDRKSEGIFAPLSVADNIMVSSLRRVSRFGMLNGARFRALASTFITDMRVRTAGLETPIFALSGGNQQKALLARLIATEPRLLILNDPMRGVDLAAKRDLYEVLFQAADRGISVLLLSTELIELCLLCDRVAVFHDQECKRVIERGQLNEETLIDGMFGRPVRTEGATR